MDKDLLDGIKSVLNFLKRTGEPQQKKRRTEEETHPALTDPMWLDATFLVGPEKIELKASRACLAAMSPVMKKIFYGTGQIVVDPAKAIEWPDYQVEAIRLVFNALMARRRKEPSYQWSSVNRVSNSQTTFAKRQESLNVKFETEFQRGREHGSMLYLEYDEEHGDCIAKGPE